MRSMPGGWAPGFHRGIELCEKTSMGVGGAAERFASPTTVAEFRQLIEHLGREGEEPFILGGGFNTIFPDTAFTRPIIHTGQLRKFSIEGNRIRAEAGLRLESLVRVAIENGLGGLEKFLGVPGTVGGAVVMNAGGGGREAPLGRRRET